MGDKSGIEWTDATWNPVTGCDKISPGCDNCYALTQAGRLKLMGQPKYQNDGDPRTSGPGFGLTCHPDILDQPIRWQRPRMVFVNSMSDLFHEDVPVEFIQDVLQVMRDTPRHTYQVLTKRSRRMAQLDGELEWPPNAWVGVSVETEPLPVPLGPPPLSLGGREVDQRRTAAGAPWGVRPRRHQLGGRRRGERRRRTRHAARVGDRHPRPLC